MTESLNAKLLRLYAPLVSRTQDVCDQNLWPATTAISRGLERGIDGNLVPVSFNDGQGPVGVAAFSVELTSIARAARSEVFEPLIGRLRESLASSNNARLEVWWAPDTALHFTIAQFTEHPCLMEEELRSKCFPLSTSDDEALAKAMLREVPALVAPRVRLHGLRLMPDGSMLLLFLEDADSEGRVNELRTACTAAAVACGQEGQPVRPKDFLHVVVGRVLEAVDCPSEVLSNAAAKEAIALEQHEALTGKAVGEHHVDLLSVSLVRDWQWFHLKFDRLGVYTLTLASP